MCVKCVVPDWIQNRISTILTENFSLNYALGEHNYGRDLRYLYKIRYKKLKSNYNQYYY